MCIRDRTERDRERQRETERDRDTDRDTERDRDRETDRQTDRQRGTERERAIPFRRRTDLVVIYTNQTPRTVLVTQ